MTRTTELPADRSVERQLLESYRAARDEAHRDLADAQARADRYELAVRGLEAVLPDEEPEPIVTVGGETMQRSGPAPGSVREDGSPRGEAAVAIVLREAGSSGLTNPELTEEVMRRGWSPDSEDPAAAVRAAANRLRKKDANFVFENRHFVYRPVPPAPFTAADGRLVFPGGA